MLTGQRRETHEHVEAELLLEMHARQLQKIMNECGMIAEKIEATEQQVISLSGSGSLPRDRYDMWRLYVAFIFKRSRALRSL